MPDAEHMLLELAEQMRASIGPDTALVGIYTGGYWLAERLHEMLAVRAPLGAIDTAYYRDDYGNGGEARGLHKNARGSNIPFDVNGAHIVIIDDVLYTGRTIRAAMNELFDYGRPARIELAVLVDRGERELPIAARFCAQDMRVAPNQSLRLRRGDDDVLKLELIEKH